MLNPCCSDPTFATDADGKTRQTAVQVTEKMFHRHGLVAFYHTPDYFQVLTWLRRQLAACERRGRPALYEAAISNYRADIAEMLAADCY